ncbi:hypothetical protein T4A_8503 [Trichinella pseudospiralis]|uniref:Secreted protein n=1 Tax=Trichinella pseudospiralis TaxID=6337 RepID=A0A0V1EIQ8_TRIPS|nr:hypothetical protein T4A_8503 [Trichinella pseudospiralis]
MQTGHDLFSLLSLCFFWPWGGGGNFWAGLARQASSKVQLVHCRMYKPDDVNQTLKHNANSSSSSSSNKLSSAQFSSVQFSSVRPAVPADAQASTTIISNHTAPLLLFKATKIHHPAAAENHWYTVLFVHEHQI